MVDSRRQSLQQSTKEIISNDHSGSYINIESTQNKVYSHSKSAFSVAIRFRPSVSNEISEIETSSIWELSHKSVYDISKKTYHYFDYVFDEKSTNRLIYDKLIKDAIKTCLSGINVTIFAYGQTSSGKTHTMYGDNKGSYDGIIPLSINEIFNLAYTNSNQSIKTSNNITVSYLEVYNEKLFDLLAPQSNLNNNSNDNNSRKVKVVDGVDGAVDFINLTSKNVSSPEDVHVIIKTGLKSRRVAETSMNERSSRSHTILRIKIESYINSNDVCVGVLNFVDLAGSESIKRTQLEGDRRKEGMSINRSLLALSQVISQLSENEFIEPLANNYPNQIALTDGLSQSKNKYINYRDSKITRILSDSLGGNSRTIIICNCSPDRLNYYETLSTIDFARRAKKIQNEVKVNILKSSEEKSQLAELKQKINKLNKQVKDVTFLKQEIELLKNQKAELLFELNTIKVKSINCPSKLTSLDIDLNNSSYIIYEEYFNHLIAEYAEIIDLKDQNIRNLNEEINSLQIKVRNVEKTMNDNYKMKNDLDQKNDKIIKKENEIKHLSKLLSDSNNKLKTFQAQLDCKDSVIENLIIKNEKNSLYCVELKKSLEFLLSEIYRFINWYICDLNSKKLKKTEYIESDSINENLDRLISNVRDYLNYISIYNQILEKDRVDYNSELSNFSNEILLLESEIKHYEEEKNKIYLETVNCQEQAIQNLNSIVLNLFELLCTVFPSKSNYHLIDNSLPNLSISDSYEFTRKIQDSEKLIKLLDSELNEKKDLEVEFKILQMEIENIKNENRILNEFIESQRKENNELRTSLNQLKHELNFRLSCSNIKNLDSQEMPNNFDYKVEKCDESKASRFFNEKSEIQTESMEYKEKKLQGINGFKENRSKENIIDLASKSILNQENSENPSFDNEENPITECNTQ
ncbi:kinesin heavy chain [Cryptosporidium ubiquitum]|uniref:Kinesin-like protein n=1 Tax=Cryptosporidium ubiquitum TaxID=857276 RepID=A0A1J4MJQ9_9CRYT|nr:kinesin heavy chain [Cryptosporidium ubiquitum]OII73085.1 kinesin heavy chain [Cryptosporidium ubiquitum]